MRRVARFLVGALILTACSTPAVQSPTVEAWLLCGECAHGERAAVAALGMAAYPVLRDALANGPPANFRDNIRAKFRSVYRTTAPSAALSESQYAERAVENFVATYKKRAALSLGDIGGAQAMATLQQASLDVSNRPDVIEVVQIARMAADTARFRGVITPAAPAFGDTVVVRPPAFEPFNNDELIELNGKTAQPLDMTILRTPDSIRFIAAALPGQHVLTVHNVGTTSQNQVTSIVVRTLMDPNDRRMATCSTTACRIAQAPSYASLPGPVKHFLTLWSTRSGMDTVDLIRFQSPTLFHVTAHAVWNTADNVDLRWIACTGATPVGNANGATGQPSETTTVDIPAGACWLLAVILKATADTPPLIVTITLSP